MNSVGRSSFLIHALHKRLDVLESMTGSCKLDAMEISTVNFKAFCLKLTPPTALLSFFSPYPLATFTIASLGLWFASRLDYVQGKKHIIETKIAHVLSGLRGQPKKALVIQSREDKYGALSTRAHVEQLRTLAKTHTIERVVVKEEKEFLRSLPPGQFDIVWIRAHGTPTSIKIGNHFKITRNTSPQIFYKLSSKIKQHGKLILECCNVANNTQAGRSIAEHIASYCRDTTVYAPLTPISGIFGFEFDKWGYPQFYNSFGKKVKNITRVIQGPEPKYRKVISIPTTSAYMALSGLRFVYNVLSQPGIPLRTLSSFPSKISGRFRAMFQVLGEKRPNLNLRSALKFPSIFSFRPSFR